MAFRARRSSYRKMPSKDEPENEKTHGILECPICLELPVKPIYQCSNGHLICKLCHSKVKLCPVCRAPLSSTTPLRNLTAEHFLDTIDNNDTASQYKEALPSGRSTAMASLLCKYKEHGCSLKPRTNGELIQHQIECKYRLVFCPDLRCSKKIPLAKLFVHINDDHPADDFTKLAKSNVNFSLVIKPAHYQDETFWKPAIMSVGHSKFFRECRRTIDGQWYFWIYMEGSAEEASQFSATIKLFNSKKEEVLSLKCCSVLALDVSPKDVSNYMVMTVQDPVIQSIEYNGKLSFFVEITRKPNITRK
jgi:hypothetical protein